MLDAMDIKIRRILQEDATLPVAEIGKAVGLMMAFHKITDEAAFDMLKAASQDMNLKLVEVARQVVEHHNKA